MITESWVPERKLDINRVIKSRSRQVMDPFSGGITGAGTDEDHPQVVPMNLDQFLNHFLANHRDDNFLAIKYGNYSVGKQDAANEVIDWTMQYLQWM